jgi:predicted nucleic acid-binding protein
VIVVSDTSPLTYLHQIGRFSLLTSLYGEVVIPPAVERELKQAGSIHEGLDWSVLRVIAPRSTDMVASLGAALDLGESEAIVVASEIHADLLLIDEANGREIARKMGIRLTGLLGLLLESKSRGFLPTLAAELDRLQQVTSFRIRLEVRREVLRLAGES